MEFKLDADAVNQFVADAILKSVLGQELQAAIDKQLKEVLHGYNSPVRKLIEQELFKTIQNLLETKYRVEIVEKVAQQLTAEHVEEVVKKSVEKAMQYLKRDY